MSVVETDIRKYFNAIPHQELMKILRTKIGDRGFLRLIDVLITALVISCFEKLRFGCTPMANVGNYWNGEIDGGTVAGQTYWGHSP